MHFFDEEVCFGCFQSTFVIRVLWASFHRFVHVLGVCQPTEVRRQLLWSIETEHKGKAMVVVVMMMMMMMMACISIMLMGMVAKWTPLPAHPTPPHPTPPHHGSLKPAKTCQNPMVIKGRSSKNKPRGSKLLFFFFFFSCQPCRAVWLYISFPLSFERRKGLSLRA